MNDDRNDGAVDDAGVHADDDIADANGGAAEALDYAGDAEDDDDEYITVGFNRTLMEIRVNALKQFLQYRRNSFKFPSGSLEIQGKALAVLDELNAEELKKHPSDTQFEG